MLDVSLENNRDLFCSPEKCHEFLLNIDYDKFSYPEEITNFHIYSEIKNEKELLCIKSFIATQNLEKCKIVLWSDLDIRSNKSLDVYKEYIDFRVYNAEEETKGTVLEKNSVWIGASDSKHYMRSGVLRFLATNKYGGVWADMDMVFLRDFKPVLGQEFAYVWGSELDFSGFGPCAAMISFKKNSDLSQLCLKEILNTHFAPDSTVLDHVLLAKVYKKQRFTVFPSYFFNTEWQLNTKYDSNGTKIYDPNGLGTQIEKGWFKKTEASDSLFLEAFSWHWHNSSYKNHAVENGSKFDLLNKLTDSRLKEKGIL